MDHLTLTIHKLLAHVDVEIHVVNALPETEEILRQFDGFSKRGINSLHCTGACLVNLKY